MPSRSHQTFLLLFRRHPELAFNLARCAGMPISGKIESIEAVSTEFDDPLNPGRAVLADLAFVADVEGIPRCGLVLEVQLDEDPNKEWTIALYRTAMRRRHKCPVWVALFSPNPRVRRQIRERMFAFEPELRPHVIMPEMIAPVVDLEVAMQDYAWAVLSVAMHPCGPHTVVSACVTIRALLRLAPEDFGRYIQLVIDSVGEEVMQLVRAQLPEAELEELSEWERRGSAYTRGVAHGREEGREEGRAALRAVLAEVMEARGLVADDLVEAKLATASIEQLRSMIGKAARVSTVNELF